MNIRRLRQILMRLKDSLIQDPTFLMSIFGTKLYKEYARKNIKTRKGQRWFANIQRKIFD